MQHMKAQGVRLGVAPYGYRHSQQLDDKGRRILELVDAEQVVIRQMVAWRSDGHDFKAIAARLQAQGILSRRGRPWTPSVLSLILEREGHHQRSRFHKTPSPAIVCDPDRAAERAVALRAEGLSLRAIGRRLRKEGLVPRRGGEWHAATVLDLLTYRRLSCRRSAAERADSLRGQGCSLREIAAALNQEGYQLPRGGRWVAASVSTLLRNPSQPLTDPLPAIS